MKPQTEPILSQDERAKRVGLPACSATLAELLHRAVERLSPVSPTARLDADVLAMHVLGLNRAGLFAALSRPLDDGVQQQIEALVQRRERGEPVAYVTGRREFWSLPLQVTPAVLIPRPETELLVERALARIPAGTETSVADLGTGSGAIALAIARERPRARIVATDTSPEALELARTNAATLGIGNIEFRRGEWLTPLAGETADAPHQMSERMSEASRAPASARGPIADVQDARMPRRPGMAESGLDPIGETFEVIVSNPPYIRTGDPHLQQGDVRFEPRAALVSGSDGLDAIRAIIRDARTHLKPGGWLLLEHGHDQAAAIEQLLGRAGYTDIRGHADLAGHRRAIEATIA